MKRFKYLFFEEAISNDDVKLGFITIKAINETSLSGANPSFSTETDANFQNKGKSPHRIVAIPVTKSKVLFINPKVLSIY